MKVITKSIPKLEAVTSRQALSSFVFASLTVTSFGLLQSNAHAQTMPELCLDVDYGYFVCDESYPISYDPSRHKILHSDRGSFFF